MSEVPDIFNFRPPKDTPLGSNMGITSHVMATSSLEAGRQGHLTEKARTRTLGNVRLRHQETSEIILIPTPSGAPDDPLNWYALILPHRTAL